MLYDSKGPTLFDTVVVRLLHSIRTSSSTPFHARIGPRKLGQGFIAPRELGLRHAIRETSGRGYLQNL